MSRLTLQASNRFELTLILADGLHDGLANAFDDAVDLLRIHDAMTHGYLTCSMSGTTRTT